MTVKCSHYAPCHSVGLLNIATMVIPCGETISAVNEYCEGMNILNLFKFSDCDIHVTENIGVCYLCVAV